ncbi:Retrovirus-related Pol polyprotein from transposon TNT 1-94 [Cardamine amara subsp. amara]|uniref:Retrovirus-related Pol polyprotein from transposon TNT 1-94 n=1 Tax=Cardamine amara subsp. amara TaxID=228776 RepID=A0ABD1C1T7_CARAN
MQVFYKEKEVLAGDYKDTLYFLDGMPEMEQANAAVRSVDTTDLWHIRLGHMNARGLQLLVKKELIKSRDVKDFKQCEFCILGKAHRISFKIGIHTSKEPLEYVHSDLWGSPNVTPSLSKCQYYMSLVDDFSRKVWVYFLRTKDEAYEKFVEWKSITENQCGKKLKALRTDNGLEYCNKTFDDHCKLHGILRHKTCPYTPQQNGVAERLNRTILEKVRSLLSETGLGESFWAEATSTVVYMINITPSTPLNFEIPEEVWSGRKPEYSHMRRFGCLVYYHVDQGKLKPRAKKWIFMGYPQGVKGYRIWSLDDKKCIVSRDTIFCEDVVYKDIGKTSKDQGDVSDPKGKKKVTFELPGDHDNVDGSTASGGNSGGGGVMPDSDQGEEENSGDESGPEVSNSPLDNYLLARDRVRRNIKKPSRFVEADIVAYALNVAKLMDEDEPNNYQEAISGRYKEQWKAAMKEEMESHHKNQTWNLIPKPEKQRVVGCKWVFKFKPEIPGVEKPRFKARLVAKGFSQIEGIDYHEVFSLVVKHITIRLMLSMVVDLNIELEQLDVKTAFLHGKLDERILMEQPEGYVKGDDKVCLLQRSLYGLKQSPRQWNLRFDQFIKSQGYSRSEYDPCVYLKCYKEDCYVYLLLYVDDMLVAAKDMKEIIKLKTILSSEFEMKDLGAASRILGMDISRDRSKGVLKLSQQAYLEKVLRKFSMDQSKPVQTPMGCHFKLSSRKEEEKAETEAEMKQVPYSNAVGSLMYAMVGSRPDLAYTVGLVSRFMGSPNQNHWDAVQWILRYIINSKDLSLTFKKSEKLK